MMQCNGLLSLRKFAIFLSSDKHYQSFDIYFLFDKLWKLIIFSLASGANGNSNIIFDVVSIDHYRSLSSYDAFCFKKKTTSLLENTIANTHAEDVPKSPLSS